MVVKTYCSVSLFFSLEAPVLPAIASSFAIVHSERKKTSWLFAIINLKQQLENNNIRQTQGYR